MGPPCGGARGERREEWGVRHHHQSDMAAFVCAMYALTAEECASIQRGETSYAKAVLQANARRDEVCKRLVQEARRQSPLANQDDD